MIVHFVLAVFLLAAGLCVTCGFAFVLLMRVAQLEELLRDANEVNHSLARSVGAPRSPDGERELLRANGFEVEEAPKAGEPAEAQSAEKGGWFFDDYVENSRDE